MAGAMNAMLAVLIVCTFAGTFLRTFAATLPLEIVDDGAKDNNERAQLVADDIKAMYGQDRLKDSIEIEQQIHNTIMNFKFEDMRKFKDDMTMSEFHDLIATSKLFALIDNMPKLGARVHIASVLGADFILEKIEKYTNEQMLYVYSKENGADPCHFRIGNNLTANILQSIDLPKVCKDKKGFAWRQMHEIRPKLQWNHYKVMLKRRLELSNMENGYQEFKDHKTAIDNFVSIYPLQSGIVKFFNVWTDMVERIVKKCIDEKVKFLEVVATFSAIYKLDKDDGKGGRIQENATKEEIFKQLNDAANGSKQSFEGMQIIFGIIRDIAKDIDEAFEPIKGFEHQIAGIDLVGFDDNYPLTNYIGIVHKAKEMNLRTYLQAGESELRTFNREGLFDAVLMADRIEHGNTIAKHPGLLKKLAAKPKPVVVCPLSGKILGLVHGEQPGRIFHREKIPIAISSDNPGFFSTKLISHDLYWALMTIAFDDEGWNALKEWILNSVEFSSFDETTKDKLKTDWINAVINGDGSYIKTVLDEYKEEKYHEQMAPKYFDDAVTEETDL